MTMRAPIAMVLGLIAFSASAQLYRWTDEQGRVHVTDTPPPASAKNVQKKAVPAAGPAQSAVPYELALAMKDFPVTLYSSPNCKAPCARARDALNRRGVPFKEVQVWDEDSNAELSRVSGGSEVPTLVVGRSVHRGFEQTGYDALLDSARYPKAGVLPERAQAAPPAPEGYAAPGERPAEPLQAEPEPPKGPYAPKPPPQKR